MYDAQIRDLVTLYSQKLDHVKVDKTHKNFYAHAYLCVNAFKEKIVLESIDLFSTSINKFHKFIYYLLLLLLLYVYILCYILLYIVRTKIMFKSIKKKVFIYAHGTC